MSAAVDSRCNAYYCPSGNPWVDFFFEAVLPVVFLLLFGGIACGLGTLFIYLINRGDQQ